jgi:uncharacterized protein YvpB/LysM repeat protein
MARAWEKRSSGEIKPGLPLAASATTVGASYPFDPHADGLASIYANRVLERGIDPRLLCAEVRADRLGIPDRGAARRALLTRPRGARFGRGTAPHLAAVAVHPAPSARRAQPRRRPARSLRTPFLARDGRWQRRFAAAGLAALLLLPLGVIVANAQEMTSQARYVVQHGDTLEGIAGEFGVDPAAILASSAIQDPPYLAPDEIVIIPAPGESPDEAAWNAEQNVGASPFVSGAHSVAPGETLADIAGFYGLDAWTVAAFNGIADIDSLSTGQLLRIPAVEAASDPETGWVSAEQTADGVGGMAPTDAVSSGGAVFATEVPAYLQAFSLSCEYAAAYIATAGLGWGVPESAFMERIGPSTNPHWGYRGDIAGGWGGADDYGVYPEAMVPTLNEFGYIADVFYGSDASALTARIDSGMPVLTWLGYFGDTAWMQEDAGAYLLAPGMHVVTVYGYDEGGVYISNPGRGNYDYYTWETFLPMWRVLDGMSLGIAPM